MVSLLKCYVQFCPGSNAKNLEDDDWKCYLCKPDPDKITRSIMEIKGKDIQQDNTLEIMVPGNLSPHDTLAESQTEQLQCTSSMEDLSSNFSGGKVESNMWSRGDTVWAKINDDCGLVLFLIQKNMVMTWLGKIKYLNVESGDLLDFKQHFTDKSIHRLEFPFKAGIQEAVSVIVHRHKIWLEFKKQYQLLSIATKSGDLLDFKQHFADKSIHRLEFPFKAGIQEAVSVIVHRHKIWLEFKKQYQLLSIATKSGDLQDFKQHFADKSIHRLEFPFKAGIQEAVSVIVHRHKIWPEFKKQYQLLSIATKSGDLLDFKQHFADKSIHRLEFPFKAGIQEAVSVIVHRHKIWLEFKKQYQLLSIATKSGDLLDFKQHFADKSIHRLEFPFKAGIQEAVSVIVHRHKIWLEFKKQYQLLSIATKSGDLLDFKQHFADKSIHRLEFPFKAGIQEAVSVIVHRHKIWLEFKKQYQLLSIATKSGDLLDFKQHFADKSIHRLEFPFKAGIQEAVSVIATRPSTGHLLTMLHWISIIITFPVNLCGKNSMDRSHTPALDSGLLVDRSSEVLFFNRGLKRIDASDDGKRYHTGHTF
ncbi:hypothetical protein CEXT_460901 [Caerostris extrusa]|uniref:Uncharacterized protein n=1 Tax=Caerostris extrusa TaxID=172846 RepID=A0AAV4MXI1_CAEEX|nr:hypothetical protein CEXT_460901 [Caerostris extrusa]